MARNLGAPASTATPPAVRASTPGWRDPRLWIGLAIVTVSVVAGAKLLDAADDTVAVWAAVSDLGAGAQLTADDLVATQVRFAEGDDLAGYFAVEDQMPADLELTRGVGAGELLPRGAVGVPGERDTLQLPIAVDAEQVPGSVEAGSVVDVYLVPSSAGPRPGRGPDPGPAAPALAGVTVVDAPPLGDGFTATGRRQLVLAVDEDGARRFLSMLGSVDSPVLIVVRRG